MTLRADELVHAERQQPRPPATSKSCGKAIGLKARNCDWRSTRWRESSFTTYWFLASMPAAVL